MKAKKFLSLLFILFITVPAMAQVRDKVDKNIIKPIDRNVKGEVVTTANDTLIGMIKIKNAEDHYITSIIFKQDGSPKKMYTAYDLLWFRQVVPYPYRDEYGVDEVFFKSATHPKDKRKKAFVPMERP